MCGAAGCLRGAADKPESQGRCGTDRREGDAVRSALYTGTLMHSRRTPSANVFRYPVCYFLLDLDELAELERRLALFSVNRPNVVSLHEHDHFDGRPLKQSILEAAGDDAVDRVLMLALPRILGYVFNPVTFSWCYGAGGGLRCIVAELSNTFGERHVEVLRGPGPAYEHEKHLHVSPFFGLDQSYEYAFSEPAEQLFARIHVRENGDRPLTAVLHGRRRELTNRSLAAALVRYPLMPHRVTTLIHWQALRLWRLGVPFHHKPPFVPGLGSLEE
jgi:DUF1365 family protein